MTLLTVNQSSCEPPSNLRAVTDPDLNEQLAGLGSFRGRMEAARLRLQDVLCSLERRALERPNP